jgi:hypothetical protein
MIDWGRFSFQDSKEKVSEDAVSSSCNESQATDKATGAAAAKVPLGQNVLAKVGEFRSQFTEKYNSDISALKKKQWVRPSISDMLS